MWLEIMGAPDIVDGGLADSLALRHSPATPMRHSRRFGLQGCIHDTGDLVDWIGGLSSATGSDVPQTVEALVSKALSPKDHRISIYRQPLCYGHIGIAGGGSKNDAATQGHLLWGAMGRRPLFEFLLIHCGKRA
jgi:hypothetical protein